MNTPPDARATASLLLRALFGVTFTRRAEHAPGTVSDQPRTEPQLASRSAGAGCRVRLAGRVLGGSAFVCLLLAVAGAALLARRYLLTDARFLLGKADDIQISGNHQLSRREALAVFAGDLDRNLFHLPLEQRRADLERLPWVEHATVMRLLPDHLRVSIIERSPVAFVRQGSQIGLVDSTGVLLDMPSDAAGDVHYSFPVLTGIAASDPLSTRRARMELYSQFLKAMAEGGLQVTESISEVDITDPEDVKAVVTGAGADVLVHFGDQDFLTRYQTFQQHLAEWRQAYPRLVSADMRYDNEIVLDSGSAGTGSAPSVVSSPEPVVRATSAEGAKPAASSSQALRD